MKNLTPHPSLARLLAATLLLAALAAPAAESRIAFTSGRSGNLDIHLMAPDGSGVVALTTNGQADVAPAWSPDGHRLAFVSRRNGTSEIYVMYADGSGQTNLTQSGSESYDPA